MPRVTFLVIFIALMVIAAGNTAIQSVLPAISRALGIADILVGLVFSVSAIFWTLSAPVWAQRADRHGRRALIQIGLTGFVVASMFGGCALLLGLRGLLVPLNAIIGFAIFRCAFGIFGSAANPAAQAYVATRTAGPERTSALSKLSASFALGTVVGPALAPFMVLPGVGLAGPMFCFALVSTLAIFVLRHYMPADAPDGKARHARKPPAKISWLDARVMPFLLFAIFVGHAQAIVVQIMGYLIIDVLKAKPGDAQSFIGAALMAGALATVLAQWGVIPNFRLSPRQLMRWGSLVILVGAAMSAAVPSYGMIVIGFSIMSLGFGLVRPGYTAGASLAVRRDEQDAVAGAITSVNGACFILAPAMGILLYHWHRHAPFYVCAVTAAMLFAYALINPVLRDVQDQMADADEVVPAFDQ